MTRQQRQREDSRQFCETLYAAFLVRRRVVVPVPPDQTVRDVQAQVAANTRHFWHSRGFQLHTEQSADRRTLWVSLTAYAGVGRVA